MHSLSCLLTVSAPLTSPSYMLRFRSHFKHLQEEETVKIKHIVAAVTMTFALITAPLAFSADKTADFPPQQEKAMGKIIHDYIVKNPQVLIEASQELQKQQQQTQAQQAEKAIADNSTQIFNSNMSPVVGNPKGDVTLVEFFDYQCIHCKTTSKIIDKLIAKNKNLRVVYKQFPIIGGESSEFAAKAALAANKQGKFIALHEALMNEKGRLSDTKVLEMAKNAGIDVAQLQKDMKDPSLDKELTENMKLATDLGVRGTPYFVIGSGKDNKKVFFVPGAATQSKLQKMITNAQNG